MKKHLISVIIPVYDTEETYLNFCFESIKNNGYDHYEVIVVNDSSKNLATRKFLSQYTKLNPQFKLINLTGLNKGPGYARNVALDHANGEIITYVDGDDYILHGMLNRINEIFNEFSDLDIFSFANQIQKVNGEITQTNMFILNTKDPVNLDLWPEGLKDKPSVWAKAYRKKFLIDHKIKFLDQDVYMEDLCYWLITYSHAKKVLFRHEIFYILRQNFNSRALSAFNIEKLKSLIHGLTTTYEQIKNLDCYIVKNFKVIFNHIYEDYSSRIKHDDEEYQKLNQEVQKFKTKIAK